MLTSPVHRVDAGGAAARWYRRCGLIALMALAPLLSSCGPTASIDTPAQRWQDLDIRVETRPSPPVAGMTEFLVMATGERGRPAYDLIVSLRTAAADPWKQAIQDGQVGVYRRSALLDSSGRSSVQVQLRRGNESGVLSFPFQLTQ